MALTEGQAVTYGEHEAGKYEKSIEHTIRELKQKVASGTATADDIAKLNLLK